MIRFMDSFTSFDAPSIRLKYTAWSASFDQDILLPGRDGVGYSFVILNTAFGEANYLNSFADPQSTWGFHLDFMVSRASTSVGFPSLVDWFRFNGPSATQLVLRVIAHPADGPLAGRMQLIDSGGNVIATSGSSIFMDVWYTIEVKATFNGSTCQATVKRDGVTWLTGGYLSLQPVSTLGFRWQAFGPPSLRVDNFLLWDGQSGGGVSDFTGRVRVVSTRPTGDATSNWVPDPGPLLYTMVNDFAGTPRPGGAPDGNLTTIRPGGLSSQFFEFGRFECFGYVWGVALNACLRPNGAFLPVRLLMQPGSTPYTIANVTPATSAYSTLQGIAADNPDTGGYWTDAAINGGYFGVSVATGVPIITAMYLEKAVSLEPIPYECGGSPYFC